MSHFHTISSIDDEQDLLQKLIHLETQIRAKRERERLLRTGQSEIYGRIFEPITREIKTLKQVETLGAPAAPPTPVPTPAPASPTPLGTPQYKTPPTTPAGSPPKTAPAKFELSDVIAAEYFDAKREIKARNREDGYLGLDIDTQTVTGRHYTINGNQIIVDSPSRKKGKIKITIQHPRTWVMLLAKNPNNIISNTDFRTHQTYPWVLEWQDIAQRLHFKDFIDNSPHAADVRKRAKFKMLQKGKGFLYSLVPPPHTVVLPSDPQGVLRELEKSIAEYKAGNSSMRNIIGPLIQQARRMKILPKYLQKTCKEFNWIYA